MTLLLLRFSLLLLVAFPLSAWTANYQFPGGPLPQTCTASGSVLTCSGSLNLNQGDTLTVTQSNVTISVGNILNLSDGVIQKANGVSNVTLEVNNHINLSGAARIEINKIVGKYNFNVYNNAGVKADQIDVYNDLNLYSNSLVDANIHVKNNLNLFDNSQINGAKIEVLGNLVSYSTSRLYATQISVVRDLKLYNSSRINASQIDVFEDIEIYGDSNLSANQVSFYSVSSFNNALLSATYYGVRREATSCSQGAKTTGNNNAGWNNPGNAKISDNNRASAQLDASTNDAGDTQYLVCTYRNFALPSNAQITGVQLDIESYRANANGNARWAQSYNYLLLNNTPSPSRLIAGSLPNREEVQSFGGPTATWGYSSLTPAMFSSSSQPPQSFVSVTSTTSQLGGGTTVYVDSHWMVVWYRGESLPTVSIGNANKNEGNSGTTTLAIPVTLSQAVTSPVTLTWTFGSGTATGGGSCTTGVDYLNTITSVTLSPGMTSGFISITVCGDRLPEPNETVVLQNIQATMNGVGLTVSTSTISPQILNDDLGPVAEYRFDECDWLSNDRVTDSSGYGNHAKRYGAVPQGSGKIGRAVNYLNAPVSQYIVTDNLIHRNGAQEITVMGWVRANGSVPNTWLSLWHLSPDNQDYASNSRQPALWQHKDNSLRLHARNDGVSQTNLGIDQSGDSLVNNQWVHVAQVVSGRTIDLYINGQLRETYTASQDLLYNDGYFYIGNRWHQKHAGIDEVKIFLRALPQTEIAQIYAYENAGLNWDGSAREPTFCTPLIEYRFDECAYTDAPNEVIDFSGNNRHATPFNGLTTQSSSDGRVYRRAQFTKGQKQRASVTGIPASAIDSGFTVVMSTEWTGVNPNGQQNPGVVFELVKNTGARILVDYALGWGQADFKVFNGSNQLCFKESLFLRGVDSDNPQYRALSFSMANTGYDRLKASHRAWTEASWTNSNWTPNDSMSQPYCAGIFDGQGSWTLTIGAPATFISGVHAVDDAVPGGLSEFLLFGYALSETDHEAIYQNFKANKNWDGTTRTAPNCSLLNHIRFEYSGTPLTCEPYSVTVKACANAACSALATTPVTLTVTATNGATPSPTTLNFTGSATVSLSKTAPGATQIAATGISPVTTSVSCNGSTAAPCTINFVDAGLLFTNSSGNRVTIPDQIAYKPFSQTNGSNPAVATGDTYYLKAVRKDTNTGACTAAVTGSRNVTLGVTCIDPNSCATPQPLSRNGVPVNGPQTLTFNSSGIAAIGTLAYQDAGKIKVTATTTANNGVTLTGETNPFVVKPVGFCVEASGVGNCSNTPNASCGQSKKAGETFNLTARAVGWASASDSDLCEANLTTRNFSAQSVRFAPEWAGADANLRAANLLGANSVSVEAGEATLSNTAVDNVGVFRFTATVEDYLGAGPVTGTSAVYGRFVPAKFVAKQPATVQHRCSAGSEPFTYLGEDGIDLQGIQFEARGTGAASEKNLTNYQGPYAKFDAGNFARYQLNASGLPSGNTGQSSGVEIQPSATPPSATISEGTITVHHLPFKVTRPSSNPVAQKDPVTLTIQPTDSDGVTLDAAYPVATLNPYALRYGKLRLDSVYGRDRDPGPDLQMPLTLEYWSGQSWVVNTDDSCTELDAISFAPPTDARWSWPSPLTGAFNSGCAQLPITGVPGAQEVQVTAMPDWLKGRNGQATTYDRMPRARATIGIYEIDTPQQIDTRESY